MPKMLEPPAMSRTWIPLRALPIFRISQSAFAAGSAMTMMPSTKLFPHLQFGTGVHAAERFAGLERFLEMSHAVPKRQRHVAKIPDIRRLLFDQKYVGRGGEKVFTTALFDQA